MSDLPVLFSELPLNNGQKIGVATLNASRTLNALSLDMIDKLLAKFETWAVDKQIAAVWLEGAGDKAFCAGGDIVALYRSMTEYTGGTDPATENPYAESFFTNEYRLDYLIHTYPKPLIVWGNGIVMGGGMGLFAGAAFRIVTESARLAMPEITIGLYPDVGGSWFLNRMPGRSGLFLALTGANFNASDALFVGLADRFITQDKRNKVLAALEEAPWRDDHFRTVSQVLREFEETSLAALPLPFIEPNFDAIQQLTDADSDLERVKKMMAYTGEDKWLKRAASSLAAGSPTAMLLIQAQLRRSRHASLREVFQQELNLSMQASLKGEFAEGIRALLIDKDKNPRWVYPTVDAVEKQWIDSFFEPLWAENPLHDL